MGLKELQSKAKWFLLNNKVKKISDGMYEIEDKIVTIKNKQGRTVTSCSCINYAKFVSSGQTCSHIVCAYLFSANENLYNQIDKSIKQAEKYKELNLPMNHLLCLDILEKIKKSK